MKLLALLDPPSPLSMGRVPLVLEEASGQLIVTGIGPRRPLSAKLYAELILHQQALGTPPVEVPDVDNLAALWIGHEFAAQATRHALSLPVLDTAPVSLEGGSAYPMAAESAYVHLQQFMAQAFKACVKSSSQDIARLMAQVLPDDERTRSALWHSAPENERAAELAWCVRLSTDAGAPVEPLVLVRRFTALWQAAKSAP